MSIFRFYGISIWLHEYMKALENSDFELRAIKQNDTIIQDVSLNTTIENKHFTNLSFINVRFVHMLLSHCTFHNCSFINCTFSNVRSSKTYFKECDFYETDFFDTDLYNYKFQYCSMNSSNFYSTKGKYLSVILSLPNLDLIIKKCF